MYKLTRVTIDDERNSVNYLDYETALEDYELWFAHRYMQDLKELTLWGHDANIIAQWYFNDDFDVYLTVYREDEPGCYLLECVSVDDEGVSEDVEYCEYFSTEDSVVRGQHVEADDDYVSGLELAPAVIADRCERNYMKLISYTAAREQSAAALGF